DWTILGRMDTSLLVPSAYLAAATIGAGFALNAHRPLARSGSLSISVFFAGWLTAELPLYHIAWQLAATAAFWRMHAFYAWPGWVGLGVALLTWVALLDLFVTAHRTHEIVERALVEGLGADYRRRIAPELLDGALPLAELLLPFTSKRRVER